MTRPPPTVESVKQGLAKIVLKLEQLKTETNQIHEKLKAILPPEGTQAIDYSWYPSDGPKDSGRTPEPKREIKDFLWDYKDTSNLEIPTRALIAIARDLDSAFVDVRAVRSTIEAIADNADLREDFRQYLKDQEP